MGGKRARGAGARARLLRELAAVLAGILRPGLRQRVCAAQQGKRGGMWENSPVGRLSFWRIVGALEAAGFVGVRNGTRGEGDDWGPLTPAESAAGVPRESFTRGRAAKVWPTPSLLTLAHTHGVTSGTAGTDWRVSVAAEAKVQRIREADLVVCLKLKPSKARMALSSEEAVEADAMRQRVRELNDAVRPPVVQGCLAPALTRHFRHCLRMGGRFYAKGAGGYTTMSEEARGAIRIGGMPTVELDLHAASLSIFIALMGAKRLPAGDLYDRVPVPGVSDADRRETVKAWVAQTLGKGRPVTRWGKDTAAGARRYRPSAVGAAVLKIYPALAHPVLAVPQSIIASLPEAARDTAVSQYLIFLESAAVDEALCDLRTQGVIGLPMHDAVIVPRSATRAAKTALTRAFRAQVGIAPRFK